MIYLLFAALLVTLISSIMVITRSHPVHALLYLIVSFLSTSVVFFLLGAPFIAALEIIIYAGAIMVLFIFVVMMLDTEEQSQTMVHQLYRWQSWAGPAVLTSLIFIELCYLFFTGPRQTQMLTLVPPEQVGFSLFTTYLLAVEMAAMLLLAGIIGAYHIGKRERKPIHRFLRNES